MISAEQFLAALQQKDLVPQPLIESLRKQVAQSAAPVPAAAIAKRLVDKGLLTAAQAKRILESPAPAAQAPAEPDAGDDFGLAPLADDYGLAPEKPKPLAPEPPPGLQGKIGGGAAHGKRSLKDAPMPSRPAKLVEKVPDIVPGQARPETPARPAKKGEPASPLGAGLTPLGEEDYGISDLPPKSAAAPKPAQPAAKKGKEADKKEKKVAQERKPTSPRVLALLVVVVVLLVAIGAVVAVAVTRPTGDEDLQAADAEFQAGRYAPAVEKYSALLTQFPRHAGASAARVHRGVARLKLATAGNDSRAALQTAKEVIGEMHAQPEFAQAGSELGTMLPAIADALARQVRRNPERVSLDAAKEALALANRYVPGPFRRPAQLAELDLSLAMSARELARPAEVEKAVAQIKQSAGQGKIVEAYARRTALLASYPELADEPRLREALQAVGQAERSAAAWVDKRQPAQSGDAESALLASAVPCQRQMKSAAPGAEGQIVFAMGAGSVYGLDAVSGKLLWQRFVGVPASGRTSALLPVPVAAGDVIVADVAGQAVLRVEATSGRVRWRQALGQPIEGPIAVAGSRVLVASPIGRLYAIEAESGAAAGYTQLPQALPVGPTAQGGLVFLPARQASLYVLSAADGKCTQVVTLGHEPGSVAAGPAVVGSLLIQATNDGVSGSNLRVMTVKAGDPLPLRPVQVVGLKGHVDAPPSVAGSRVAVATDRGAAYLFDATGAEEGKPLKLLNELPAEGQELVARYPLLQTDRLWVAGAKLGRYTMTPDGSFDARQTSDLDSLFLQSPVAAGGAVVLARRCGSIPGVRVEAVNVADASPYWETHLGAPLASDPVVADGALIGVTAAGGAFRIDPSALKGQAVLEQAVLPAAEDLVGPVSGSAALEGGLIAFAGQGSRLLWIFDPRGGEKSLRRVALPDAVPSGVSAFAGGAVVPGRLGQVALIDARSGDKLMEPFQPVLPGGVDYAWRTPSAAETLLVLADGRSKLYVVEESKDPKRHLRAAAEAEVGPIASPVAVAGQVAYAADASGTLAAYRLPKLERGQTWPLGSRCVWGPRAVGKRVLIASAAGKLLCLDADAKLVWQVDLAGGPPVGNPLESSGSYLLASASGVVLKIDAAGGKQSAKLDLGRPLSAGPVSAGGKLFVAGADGTVYEIKQF